MKKVLGLVMLVVVLASCSRVEPNYEGVLMENYGRNGKSDFKVVTGKQNTMWAGVQLYQVPMFETSGDCDGVKVNAKDAGKFFVDPVYQYQPIRGKGVEIVFNYKHFGVAEPEVMMDNIEKGILNRIVVNAYREEARNYSTDSLMNNLNSFESKVQDRLREEFGKKYDETYAGVKYLEYKKFMNAEVDESEYEKAEDEIDKIELHFKININIYIIIYISSLSER